MKTIALMLLAGLLGAQDGDRIGPLIQALGDPEYAEREKAKGELLKIGTPAVAALERALKNSDPEIAQSARDLLDRIRRAQALSGLVGPGTKVSIRLTDAAFEEAAQALGLAAKIPDSLKTVRVSLDFENAELLRVLDDMARQARNVGYRFEDAASVAFFADRWVEYPSVYAGPFKFSVLGITTTTRKEFAQNSADVDVVVAAQWEGSARPVDYSIQLDEALDQDGRKIERTATRGTAVPGPMIRTNGVTVRVLYENGRVRVVTDGDTVLGGKTLSLLQAPTSLSRLQSLRATATFRLMTNVSREIRIDAPAAGVRQTFGEGAVRIDEIGERRVEFSLLDLPSEALDADSAVIQSEGKDHPAGLQLKKDGGRWTAIVPEGVKSVDALKLSLREVVHHRVPFEFKDLDLR